MEDENGKINVLFHANRGEGKAQQVFKLILIYLSRFDQQVESVQFSDSRKFFRKKDMGQRGLDSRSGRRRARMKGPRSLTSRALSSYLFLQDWHSQCRPSFFLIFVLRGANFFLALLILISEATLSSKSSFKHAFGQYFDLIF